MKKVAALSTTPVDVSVYVNYIIKSDLCYQVSWSGFCFDTLVTDDTVSSADVIDSFASEHESFWKCCLPPPKDAANNYREMFLKKAGFNSDKNLRALAYCRYVSFNPVVGDMDVTVLKIDGAAVNRRYPINFVHLPNVNKSNASEFSTDLKVKAKALIEILRKMEFKFTSKGPLGGRKVNYVFRETDVDVSLHPTSREFEQMKLLIACCVGIKDKEKSKRLESPVSKDFEVESVVPLTPLTESLSPPLTPGISDNLKTMQVEENSSSKKTLFDDVVVDSSKVENREPVTTSSPKRPLTETGTPLGKQPRKKI